MCERLRGVLRQGSITFRKTYQKGVLEEVTFKLKVE